MSFRSRDWMIKNDACEKATLKTLFFAKNTGKTGLNGFSRAANRDEGPPNFVVSLAMLRFA